MVQKKFRLSAKVSSDNPPAIKPALERIFEGKGTIKETDQGFEIDAELSKTADYDPLKIILTANIDPP